VPRAWPRFEILFRYRSAKYEIAVENPRGVSRGVSHGELDGITVPKMPLRIALADDGKTHRVRVILG
jgi:cyclic beta-1,2-glucan synthetase